ITSLQQAALIGHIDVDVLINTLRQAVGQDLISSGPGVTYQTKQPSWFKKDAVTKELDARSMLAAGEQPVNQVMADLAAMEPGKIYKLVTSFLPAPLIDKSSSLGIQHWVNQVHETLVEVYFLIPE
ncbi:MAG: hypothetical protein P1S60_13635, partial [Anaerolineae bacterium]|nr:hypothetical protein [Anaerolineae bacterium]